MASTTITGMAMDRRQHRTPPGLFPKKLFPRISDSPFTMSPTVTRSVRLMTESTARSPTVQSENTFTKKGFVFVRSPTVQSVSPTITRSDTVSSLMTVSTARSPTVQSENTFTKKGFVFVRSPTVQSEDTNEKHEYDFSNFIEERFRQLSVQITQRMNDLFQKIIVDNSHLRGDKSVPVITPQNSPTVENVRYVYDHFAQNFTVQVADVFQQVQTDSDADSFDDERPPRGDTNDRNSPAFWHLFLPPEHHEHTPSVKHTKYHDCLKYTNLFLITIKIDDRYGDGWNEILFEDRFGDSWHK